MSNSNAEWSPPEQWHERAIAWRASRIHDPARRLRFLRRVNGVPRCRRRRIPRSVQAALLILTLLAWPPPTTSDVDPVRRFHDAAPALNHATVAAVWLVDAQNGHEVYSNGLRVETRYETDGNPRSYLIYDAASEGREAIDAGSQPAGIIYHGTESLQAPFEAGQNRTLQRIGESLLSYVRSRRSYNYVIDRFGRVWRVVPEMAMANHAGWSVWASGGRVWVNLNRSFLGVAFESRTAGATGPKATPAQVQAARTLTEMLRARYRIPAENCVTHAQVSVSPGTFGIGYHTDWIAEFPFQQLGLSANYGLPAAALFIFGFGYDPPYATSGGEPLQEGLRRAEETLRQEAIARGVSPQEWRNRLQRKYRQIRTTLQSKGAAEENDSNER